MIHNATITQIDFPNPPDADGDITYTPMTGLSVRCALTGARTSQRIAPDAVTQTADATLTVLKSNLATLPVPAPLHRYTVIPDTGSACTYRVIDVSNQQNGSMSHWVLKLKSE